MEHSADGLQLVGVQVVNPKYRDSACPAYARGGIQRMSVEENNINQYGTVTLINSKSFSVSGENYLPRRDEVIFTFLK